MSPYQPAPMPFQIVRCITDPACNPFGQRSVYASRATRSEAERLAARANARFAAAGEAFEVVPPAADACS